MAAASGGAINVMPLEMFVPSRRKCVILDLNGLLLKRYKIHYYQGKGTGWVRSSINKLYNVFTPPKVKGKGHFQYVVRPDALHFIQACGQHFKVAIWSSCT